MNRSAFLAAALVLAPPALAQEVDPALGRNIALNTCAACHRIDADPDGPSPNPNAPRFADVARMPSATALSIGVFLRSTHASMPNFNLGVEEIDSLTSYLLGLARPRAR